MLYLTFVIIALIWLIFATICDLKTREIPNWLNFSLIAIGLGGRLIYSLMKWDYGFIMWGLIGFGVFFALSNAMYYTKQWGGGDGKLLMGMGAMFGDYHNILNAKLMFPFLLEFIINLAIVGAALGLLWSIYLAIKKKKEFVNELKGQNWKVIVPLFLVLVVLSSLPSFLISELIIFAWALPALSIILLFIYFVDRSCMFAKLKPSQLTEGDWLADDVKVGKKVIVPKKNTGLDKEQIEILKKKKLSVIVKEGIPFVPAFLIGFVVTVVWGNLLLYLL